MVKLEGPDQGQAWVVALAACLINVIATGLSRMGAFFYVEIIETYGVSRQVAAEPFVVRGSLRCLGGPIIGVIGQRYGVKIATFWGGVVCSLGIGLCCISPNVFWLTVFWGGLFGFGHGLACTLYPVLINQYFVKHRATALGIAVSGASIGSFLLPVITIKILDAFGLSGGFLIFSGIAMHILPLSLLFTSPQWLRHPNHYTRFKALKMKLQTAETLERDMQEFPPEEEGRKVGTLLLQADLVKNEDLSDLFSTMCGPNSIPWDFDKTGNIFTCSYWRRNTGGRISAEKSLAIPISTVSGELEKKQRDINSFAACEKEDEESSAKKTSFLQSIRGIGILYTNIAFLLISVCMALYTIIYNSVSIVVVDYATDKSIPESYGIYILNSVAAGELIGRLCFGWVTDKKILSVSSYLVMICILKAVFLFLLPLVTNFYYFMLLLALYGTTGGTVMTHYPLLILRYVDRNLQSVAMGCEGFLSGIVVFSIPSIVGYFRDDVGSYDGMFYLMGSMSIVSACFWSLIPSLAEFQCKKQRKIKDCKRKLETEQHFKESKSTLEVSTKNEQNSNS